MDVERRNKLSFSVFQLVSKVITRAFVSYSHADESFRGELNKHMSLLQREGLIDIWSDHRIPPGGELDGQISASLEEASLILLLVSPDFIASDYCIDIEMTRALEKHDAGEAVVVPIILRPCDFKSSPFGRLKALPTDAKPVALWPNRDQAFLDVVQQLRALLRHFSDKRPRSQRSTATSTSRTGIDAASGSARTTPRSANLSLPVHFTDKEKSDFAAEAYEYIRSFFAHSLSELQVRNRGVEYRMDDRSTSAFSVVLFRDGKRVAGCRIRRGPFFSAGDGIAYSSNENSPDSTCNESLSVEADSYKLYLKPMMAARHEARDALSEQGAAEYLWSLLIGPLQSY